jgi:hypothetical protein
MLRNVTEIHSSCAWIMRWRLKRWTLSRSVQLYARRNLGINELRRLLQEQEEACRSR